MKIALVHELLTMRGGAERVLRILADMYPEAPIYTLLYNEKKLGDWFPKERVRTCVPPARIYKLLPSRYRYNHHLYLNHFPKMIESFDFSEFDMVLSTSSAFAHGIITNGAPRHISYIHAPARYLWDRTHDVLDQASKGPLGFLKRWYLRRVFHHLRIWDSEAAARADTLLAASKDVQRRVELYWRRESEVVYPPIDNYWLEERGKRKEERGKYFLIASTLVPYKKIDLAIEACNQTGSHLKIVGEGPDKSRLQKLAGSSIEFLGYVNRDELRDLYTNAEAVIFPGEEDFGLVPLEAMACGTPVIAYKKGGALETIVEGETGCFFEQQTPESLAHVIQDFSREAYDESTCRKRAEEFSEERFRDAIYAAAKSDR